MAAIASPVARRTDYRADVDGLRAVAVLAVVFFHAGLGADGGYVGVDVFLVISGFLITSLIMKDVQRGEFRLVDFWGRRARRIAPAMLVMLAATFMVGSFVLLPDDFKELGQSMIAQATMMANVYFWREAGYFAGPSELKPLLHMWSLAVEEQFYILMPPLLVGVYKFWRSGMPWIVAAVLCGSLVYSIWSVRVQADAAFFLLPSRAWELLLGSLLAVTGLDHRSGQNRINHK